MKRIQEQHIINDLNKKMVLIVGPRQAGKTWIAKSIMKQFSHPLYLNYDSQTDREIMQKEDWLQSTNLLILDELHKMPNWKNYAKGIYDTKPDHMKMIITGSARLDFLHHSGDSLAGRYFMHHLMPLSPSELNQLNEKTNLEFLMGRSGFPEPYLSKTDVDAKRWRKQYINSLLTIDALELTEIHNISALKLIFDLLRHNVGSSISYQSISRDVGISPGAVKRYIDILEALYVIFRVRPYSKNIARSILKEPKVYFFDTGLVIGDEGAKFENIVANSLLKHVYAKNDYEAENFQLHYLKTKEGVEVDFALANNEVIELMIEVKNRNDNIHKGLLDFQNKYGYPAVQVAKELKQERKKNNIEVLNGANFLESLYL